MTLLGSALELARSGDANRAISALPSPPPSVLTNETICRCYANIYLSGDDYANAVHWFEAALRSNPHNAISHAGKGLALQSLGRCDEAVASYDRALHYCPDDAETHYNRGVALERLGRKFEAMAAFDTALVHKPLYKKSLLRKACVLAEAERTAEGLAILDYVLTNWPDATDALCLRGRIRFTRGYIEAALADFDATLSREPQSYEGRIGRAAAYKELARYSEALSDIEAALDPEHDDAEARNLHANILMDLGREEDARVVYERIRALKPAMTRPAVSGVPTFRALFLFSPFAGNTPYEDLITHAAFESNLVMLLPGIETEADVLRPYGDVVVNLVSDVDRTAGLEREIERLTADLGLPVVNPPSLITKTSRQDVAAAVAGIDDCVAPSTRRMLRHEIETFALEEQIKFPLVVRVAGTHGGERMERVANRSELTTFVADHVHDAYYVSPFVDYRSSDGYYRKYRFFCVGERVLAYHLAIGSGWKVHHASTDMADHAWMQAEEKLFLENPESVFSARAWLVLEEIRRRIGLDFFGIDCALDDRGRVVVFEANATMLVHLHNDQFPYKDPAVRKIKEAFAELLASKARRVAAA